MTPYSKEEIRTFFTRRSWIRPKDYSAIRNQSISTERQIQLSWYMRGYFSHAGAGIRGVNGYGESADDN